MEPTTPVRPVPVASVPPRSINDDLPTSSPSPRSTLIGLAIIVSVIVIAVLYYKIIGF